MVISNTPVLCLEQVRSEHYMSAAKDAGIPLQDPPVARGSEVRPASLVHDEVRMGMRLASDGMLALLWQEAKSSKIELEEEIAYRKDRAWEKADITQCHPPNACMQRRQSILFVGLL